jgi:nucleoid-associated protein YgaU
MFGRSMEKKVNEALDKLRARFPGTRISATVDDKIVTLQGEAPDLATKQQIMTAFNEMVKTDNTINQISIPQPTTSQAAGGVPGNFAPGTGMAGGGATRVHEVVRGDTLSGIAKNYYGNASQYMRIFEANRDVLDDPDKIKVGQRLKIPR